MTTRRQSRIRFETLNRMVDEWFPKLSNAEAVLLAYYFRHAKVRYSKTSGQSRNVFEIGDGRAGQDLGRSRQAIRFRRQALMKAGIIHHKKTPSGKWVWYIGDPLPA